jgi:predicted amidohydrolase YtcJ
MRVAVTNIGRIVSGSWQQPHLHGDTVICADGLITSVGTASAQDVESADVVIDAGGTTLIPGLIDSHVHITFGDYTPRQRTVGYLKATCTAERPRRSRRPRFTFPVVQRMSRASRRWRLRRASASPAIDRAA